MKAKDYTPQRVDRTTPSDRAKFRSPWIPFDEGAAIVKEMRRLMAQPNEGRPNNLALLADSGFGKSHLLDYFADSFPDVQTEDGLLVQVLRVELPPESNGAAMLRALLRTMDVGFSSRTPPDELLRKVVVHLKSLHVRLVMMDEFHNALGGRRDRVISVVQTLRSLSNESQRPIVIAGTSKVDEVLRHDEQLDERFSKWRLPSWNNIERLMALMAGFESHMQSPDRGYLGTRPLAKTVLDLTNGRMGRIASLLRYADEEAVRTSQTRIGGEILKLCAKSLVGREKASHISAAA